MSQITRRQFIQPMPDYGAPNVNSTPRQRYENKPPKNLKQTHQSETTNFLMPPKLVISPRISKTVVPNQSNKIQNPKNLKQQNFETPQIKISSVSPVDNVDELKRYSEPPRSRNFDFSMDDQRLYGTKTAPVVPIKQSVAFRGQKNLKIKGLQLKALPKSLFRMLDLENLHLSPERTACMEYKLPNVPKEIGNLQKLQTLVLDTNELKNIPSEISLLSQLKVLTLSNNCLSTLPLGFNNLKSLESLHLANNRLTEFPIDVCELINLRFLDVSDNSIRELPDRIQCLTKVSTMILYLNDIKQLPMSFCKLINLTTLWLGQNQITHLPVNFGNLKYLDWGSIPCSANVDGNPLKSPPIHICREGIISIKEYFQTISRSKMK